MDSWHATFLGLRHLPREVTAFEVEVFFQFAAEEARIIEERRRPELGCRQDSDFYVRQALATI